MKPRLIILTDIDNKTEIDDIQSLIRLLLYSNELDLEGIISVTSCFYKKINQHNLDIIEDIISRYEKVKANLDIHAQGYPSADYLRSIVSQGITVFGRKKGRDFCNDIYDNNPGVQLLVKQILKNDSRPLNISLWGGGNTLVQAIDYLSRTLHKEKFVFCLKKLKIYAISDQDFSTSYLRKRYGKYLYYIVSPSYGGWLGNLTYYKATWPGISSDKFKHGSEDGHHKGGFSGADYSLIDNTFIKNKIKPLGILGEAYPYTKYITEGDTPSFLWLVRNGLNNPEHIEYGSWGGRYEKRIPTRSEFHTKEIYPIYTNSYDLVYGKDQKFHYSPQASIWRWREHFQNDFLMRLTWSTTNDYSVCDHLQEYDDSEVIIEANSDEEKEISLSIIEDASYEYAYKFYQYQLSDKESEISIKSDKNKALIKSSKKGIYHVICEFSRKKNFKITRYKHFIIIVK